MPLAVVELVEWLLSHFWTAAAALGTVGVAVSVLDNRLNDRPLRDSIFIAVGSLLAAVVGVGFVLLAFLALLASGTD